MNNKKNNKQESIQGFFGPYGGRFVPVQLEPVLAELDQAYEQLKDDRLFLQQLNQLYHSYVGRPSNLYLAENLTEKVGGGKIFLKREDLNHTGAHKINNTVGQALVARHLGKKKLIAETGAGQHGVATATVAALFGFDCDVYMGARDVHNQAINVARMQILGARVMPVHSGRKTLKDAVDAALTAFVAEPDSYYMLGSAVGPHPYPSMVRDFQKVISQEIRDQIMRQHGALPQAIVACIGGGSNAIGAFYDFIATSEVRLIGVEPAGLGEHTDKHGMAIQKGEKAIIHGFTCKVLHKDGQIAESYSAASGLDYPGAGPELCYLADLGRMEVEAVSDQQAANAFQELSRTEGIIPALESAHAVYFGMKLAKQLKRDEAIVINLSGRGDKDVEHVSQSLLKLPPITQR